MIKKYLSFMKTFLSTSRESLIVWLNTTTGHSTSAAPKEIVRHLRFELYSTSHALKKASEWAAFFFYDRPSLDTVPEEPIVAFHAYCTSVFKRHTSLARIILIDEGSPLERAYHNRLVVLGQDHELSHNDRFLFVPEIEDVMDYEKFINAPKKYIPFLANIDVPFDRVIFYYDSSSSTYYEVKNNILYINTLFVDECPMTVVHTAIARNFVLPSLSSKLKELRNYQNSGLAPIDGFSTNLEDRFVNDYVAHMMGHHRNVFVGAAINS